MTPPTSNAYYTPLLNEICVSCRNSGAAAFDVKASDAMTTARWFCIGHESATASTIRVRSTTKKAREKLVTDDDLKNSMIVGARGEPVRHYFIEPGVHHNGNWSG